MVLLLNEREVRKRAEVEIKFTEHARLAMREDSVLTDDVISALLKGEVIEIYPDDKPFPSCLVYGRIRDEKTVACCLRSSSSHRYINNRHRLLFHQKTNGSGSEGER